MNPTTPVLHTDNITGSPLVTAGGVAVGVGQYLVTNGAVVPHDTQSWVQFAIGLILAVLGALGRMPTATPAP